MAQAAFKAPAAPTLAEIDMKDEAQLHAWEAHALALGLERVLVESARLRQQGLLDSAGTARAGKLPADMQPGADTDTSSL